MPTSNAPFGDIYSVQTPALQRAANLLYQRQQQEDARGYQDYVNTQSLLQKEIGNVRSADEGDYIKMYQDYKDKRQQMLFDHKIKNNPKLYAQKNREATEAFNSAMQFAKASKELKDQDTKLSNDIYTRPHNYLDEAHGVLQQNLNVPMNKRQDTYDTYAYTGADKDIQPLLAKAVGTPAALFVDEANASGDLQSQQRKYMVGNSPQGVYDNIYSSLTDRKYAKALSQLANETTPEDLATIDVQYDQIIKSLPESFRKKLGGVDIKINPNNPLSIEAAYLAKKLAIDKFSKIGEGELIKKTNLKDAIDYRHKLGMQSIAANKANAAAKGTEIEDVYSGIKSITDAAEKNGTYAQMNVLDASAQKALLDYANSIAKAKDIFGKDADLTQENTLLKNVNGVPTLFLIQQKGSQADYVKGKGIRAILPLNSFDINSKINTTARQRQELIKRDGNNSVSKPAVKDGSNIQKSLPTKHKAKMPDGSLIYSDDGENWVDKNGKPVQ